MLTVAAVVLVKHPGVILGSGPVDPEKKTFEVNPALRNATSVLSVEGPTPVSLILQPKTVALTFDDGPSAEWTRKIQDVLDEYGVPGTFFVIGANVVKYPGVVRDLAAAGHEIGNHSYTHAELGTLSARQIEWQIRLTDRVVAGATGKMPTVMRPPFSGESAYLPRSEYDAARIGLSSDDRLLVLSDRSPRDFERDTPVEDIVELALPAPGTSAVITLHDAGGDRSKTVAALHALIPRLQADGYTFVRASDIVVHSRVASPGVPAAEQRFGHVFVLTASTVDHLVRFLYLAAVAAVVLGLGRLLFVVLFASLHRRRERHLGDLGHHYENPVTVIVAAHNEEVGIAATVSSIAASDYPDLRIIVVDDGSTDRTAQIVRMLAFDNVRLIVQENAGKWAALNAGIAAANTEVVVMVDGDTIFEPDTVREVVQPFADPEVGAVAGNAKVGNRSKIVARMQHVEYSVASALERRMYAWFGVSPCVPGAIGAFRRHALIEVNGLSCDTLAEDSDLTIALARRGWRIDYVPTARAWTEAPSTWRGLLKQRRRWSYGVLQVIAKHRGALVEPGRGGRLARIVFPYQVFVSYIMAVFAPAIDLMLVHNLVFEPEARLATLLVWSTLNVVNTGVIVHALHVDGERAWPVWWVAFAQQFLYRQVLYIAALRSMVAAVLGVRQPWQTASRVGGLVALR